MADITLKRLRAEVNNLKSKLTDKEFFLSKAFEKLMRQCLDALTLRFKRKYNLVLKMTDDEETASSDGKTVIVNIDNPWAKGQPRKIKYAIARALLAHECGHNLFTSFDLLKEAQEKMKRDRVLYPEPESSKYDRVLEFLSKYGATPIIPIWFHLWNAIEDAYIEMRIVEERPGYKAFLNTKRKIKYEKWDSYEEMIASGKKKVEIILSLIFIYASYNKVKADVANFDSEEVKALFKIRPLIDKARICRIPELRYQYFNEVFCEIFPYIEELFKDEEEKEEESSGSSESDSEEETSEKSESSKESKSSEETSEKGSEKSEGSEEKESSDESKGSEEETSGTEKSSEESESSSEETEGSESSSSPFETSLSKEEMEKIAKSFVESLPETHKEGEETRTSRAVKEDAKTAEPLSESAYEESEEDSIPDESIKLVEEDAAKEAVEKKIEAEIERENKELDKEIAYDPKVHAGVKCNVTRQGVADNAKEAYDRIAPDLLVASKAMEKELRKQIKDAQDGGKLDGLYSGQRIDAHALTRPDMKYFYRNILPEDIPDMAVCLLIDESGSMHGTRISAARKAAIVLYNFCVKCGIPIAILGHTEKFSSGVVQLNSYAEFDSIDKKDVERLMSISSKENNRDGYALRFCAEKLDRRKEELKLLFVISDGEPAARDYSSYNGKADVQNVVQTYRKKGMNIITAGIGSDRKSVEYIYNSGLSAKRSATYLDIEDMDKLPKTFVKIVKSFLEKSM